jgi:hypothetical protein
MEISQIYDAYLSGRVRHFKPYLAPGNLYHIELQVLCRKADDTGDFWRNDSLRQDGNIMLFKSQSDAIDSLASAGLLDAYNQRFSIDDDGVTILNW